MLSATNTGGDLQVTWRTPSLGQKRTGVGQKGLVLPRNEATDIFADHWETRTAMSCTYCRAYCALLCFHATQSAELFFLEYFETQQSDGTNLEGDMLADNG